MKYVLLILISYSLVSCLNEEESTLTIDLNMHYTDMQSYNSLTTGQNTVLKAKTNLNSNVENKWYKDGLILPEVSSLLTLTSVTTTDAGIYMNEVTSMHSLYSAQMKSPPIIVEVDKFVKAIDLGSDSDIQAERLTKGNNGGYFLSAYLSGTTTLNGTTYSSGAKLDGLIIKFDKYLNIEWVFHISDVEEHIEIWNYGHIVDKDNNFYFGFDALSNFTIGTDTYLDIINQDSFIVKLNTKGEFLWSQRVRGSTDGDWRTGMALDSNQDFYLYAAVRGPSIELEKTGTQTISTGALDHNIIVKFDKNNGNYINHAFIEKTSASGWGMWGFKMKIDSQDNIYIINFFEGSFKLSDKTTFTSSGVGWSDANIIKFNSNFEPLWSKVFASSGDRSSFEHMEFDRNDNPVLSGSFSGTIDYGTGLLTGAGGTEQSLVKLSKLDGSTAWAHHISGTTNNDNAIELYNSPSGKTFAIGCYNNGGGNFTFAGQTKTAISGIKTCGYAYLDLDTGALEFIRFIEGNFSHNPAQRVNFFNSDDYLVGALSPANTTALTNISLPNSLVTDRLYMFVINKD